MHKKFKFIGFTYGQHNAYILSHGKVRLYSSKYRKVSEMRFGCDILDIHMNTSGNRIYAISKENVFVWCCDQHTPKVISKLANKNIIKILAKENVLLAFSSDKKIYVYGDNSYGQLGQEHPSKVGKADFNELNFPDKNIIQIQNSGISILLLCDDGDILGWGNNALGQLGFKNIGNQKYYTAPKIINISKAVSEKIIQISMAYANTLFLGDQGNVYGCGSNIVGQLGLNGIPPGTSLRKVPIANIKKINTLGSTSLLLNDKNELYICGYNLYGDLGLGHTETQTTFALLNLNAAVLFVDLKNNIAYTENDKLIVWGLREKSNHLINVPNENIQTPQEVIPNVFTEALKAMYREKLKQRWMKSNLLGRGLFRQARLGTQSDVAVKTLRF